MNKSKNNLREEALLYHSQGRPGKIEVIPTKPYNTQNDLALAYSPGVAEPCLEIEKNSDDAYKYTAKGNLVAVVSNGTAVLGLGNIGALAGKPVMEGKGLLFKTFADIDVFDIEVDTTDVDKFIETVKNISPTFGGINLEDIKAPECFEIEERLKNELSIPVMHDDQHGTAIISSAALINALEIVGKKIEEVQVVVNGAGAAAISCSKLYVTLGVKLENLVMCDSKGVISNNRTDLNSSKKGFATNREITTLKEALVDADVFLGLSVADVLTQEMVKSMAKDPIVFALANPNPEITYESAISSREDIIFATGRSDYPNQVNNVLGFPYIFRGALDVRATKINEEMKIAATKALAILAKEPVPEVVAAAYNSYNISFGRNYLIPKPLDPRLITCISIAVAKAAMKSGVAKLAIDDWDKYAIKLEKRMSRDNKLMRQIRSMVYNSPKKRVVFSDGDGINTLKAAANLSADHMIKPILVGDQEVINRVTKEHGIDISECEVIDFRSDSQAQRRERYSILLHKKLNRKGISNLEAERYMLQKDWFSLMMVESGDANAIILGYNRRYTKALETVRHLFTSKNNQTIASMVIVHTTKGPLFFADTAVNANPTTEELVDITKLAADAVKKFGIEPVVAMLSNSNFGTDTEEEAIKVAKAVEIIHERYPELLVDGEMKADVALDATLRSEYYPFNKLGDKEVNTLIFPNISAANISYKFMKNLGGSDVTGPITIGLNADVHLISDTASMRSIIKLAVLAAAGGSEMK